MELDELKTKWHRAGRTSVVCGHSNRQADGGGPAERSPRPSSAGANIRLGNLSAGKRRLFRQHIPVRARGGSRNGCQGDAGALYLRHVGAADRAAGAAGADRAGAGPCAKPAPLHSGSAPASSRGVGAGIVLGVPLLISLGFYVGSLTSPMCLRIRGRTDRRTALSVRYLPADDGRYHALRATLRDVEE